MMSQEITLELIKKTLASVDHVAVEWSGYMPRDTDDIFRAANDKFLSLTQEDVMTEIEKIKHTTRVETEAEMIIAAISSACEPDDISGGGCVAVHFTAQVAE